MDCDKPVPARYNIAIVLLLLAVQSSLSYAVTEDESSIARLIGESPTEMLRQLQRNQIALNHATYFSRESYNYYKDEILDIQLNGNVDSDLFFWDFDDVTNAASNIGNDELFILETFGKIDPLRLTTYDDPVAQFLGGDELYPQDLVTWQTSFTLNNPLLLLDAPYAGAYLPKIDSFVSRLVRDATIIAPTSFNSPQFTKSLLCNLLDQKTIGEAFKDARNFHYNGGSESASDNYIGLVLQSYTLYGDPTQIISMPFTERQQIAEYCNNFLENSGPGIVYLGQVGNYSKFRKHVVMSIPSYNLYLQDNFSIINATPAYQNYEYGELVLPIAVRTTHFPKNT